MPGLPSSWFAIHARYSRPFSVRASSASGFPAWVPNGTRNVSALCLVHGAGKNLMCLPQTEQRSAAWCGPVGNLTLISSPPQRRQGPQQDAGEGGSCKVMACHPFRSRPESWRASTAGSGRRGCQAWEPCRRIASVRPTGESSSRARPGHRCEATAQWWGATFDLGVGRAGPRAGGRSGPHPEDGEWPV